MRSSKAVEAIKGLVNGRVGRTLELVAGKEIPSLVPLLVDQTAMGGIQVITGSYPINWRSVPLVMATFEYSKLKASQNIVEEDFLTKLADLYLKRHKWSGL